MEQEDDQQAISNKKNKKEKVHEIYGYYTCALILSTAFMGFTKTS